MKDTTTPKCTCGWPQGHAVSCPCDPNQKRIRELEDLLIQTERPISNYIHWLREIGAIYSKINELCILRSKISEISLEREQKDYWEYQREKKKGFV